MMIRRTRLFLNEELELLTAFDPRQVVAVLVHAKEVEVFNIDRVYPISRKISIHLPIIKNSGIQIRSIQKVKQCIIIETTGPLTPQVLAVARKISEAMKIMELKDAYFPAYTSIEDTSLFFIGDNIDSLKYVNHSNMNKSIENIRMANDHILVFNDGRELKKMPAVDMWSENWGANSLHTWTAPEDMVFIGRVKNLLAPITLKSGKVISVDIFTGIEVETQENLLNNNITSGVGHVYKGIGVAIENNDKLIVYPR